ncbi:F-box protein SKIP23-like [Euphorbia lathyris]|uniref:F-box protein SKIP23-like n=1 Tax=Euphorbia lathyris TaxID=212925 RepID=UPI003313420F
MSNWADLPSELLQEIARKHTDYVDYLYTRAVCKSWNLAIAKRPRNLSSQLPFLLLPYYRENPGHRGFYNVGDEKTYSLELPEALEKRCCGSSHGWLIMVEDTPSIFLLNPLTRAKIELPSLSTFPTFPTDLVYLNSRNLNENCIMREKLHIRDTFIVKAVLSADPSTANVFIAAVIYGFNENLAYCRSNDSEWKIIDPHRRYKDALFREGKLYTVDQIGRISVFDEESNSMIHIADPPPVSPKIRLRQWYLASCNEEKEVLVIARYRKIVPDYEYKTERFEVYKLEESGWRYMESLGDKMIFLGSNSSLCISADEYSRKCKGNCIYFSDDYVRLGKDYAWEGHDFGIFELEDGEIKSLGLPSFPMKQPCFPHIFYFELSLYRTATSFFVLPPPVWVTVSP